MILKVEYFYCYIYTIQQLTFARFTTFKKCLIVLWTFYLLLKIILVQNEATIPGSRELT